MLILTKSGRQRIDLTLRYRINRVGGWQVVEGRLPASVATGLRLTVPRAGTEITLSGGAEHGNVTTAHDGETVATALIGGGLFKLQWRAKADRAPLDHSLAAHGTARLDVQEEGLYLRWECALEFRRDQRDAFTLAIPEGYLVERVYGSNVRGWRMEDAGGRRRLEVTLLQAAEEKATFTVLLSRRGAVGSGDLATLTAPVITVEGAAQQSGELTIRRSPLLDLRSEKIEGASRADLGAPKPHNGADESESPLGVLPFQVYRFSSVSFTVQLSARPITAHVRGEWQTVLKISQRERTLESRLRVTVTDRPVYRLHIGLPNDLQLEQVSSPQAPEWDVEKQGDRRVLSLYLPAGEQRTFDILLTGRLGEFGPIEALELPRLELIDADEQADRIEQSGSTVVQCDPSLSVRAEMLKNCETELLARVFGWLNEAQRPLAQLAIRYASADYSGQLRLVPRKPQVSAATYSNIRVTNRTVEETVLIDYTIREAGVRSLSFLLPTAMRNARISAPFLRQKTLETVGEGAAARVRVRLDLQEAVMNNLRVLIENDRLLASEGYEVPIPQVENATTDQRYVTLESAGATRSK